MASTYSTNLRIELIGNGEQANTWGDTTNTNLGTLIEQAISGLVSVDVTAGNVTLTTLNGVSDQSRQMIIVATGTPGVTRTITAPAVNKVYVVYNNSNAVLSFIASGGTGVSLNVGAKKLIYCNGTGFVDAINTVTVTSGSIDGTTVGATTASTGSFTSLAYSTTFTGGTGIVNLGSGQLYKDATGKVGIGGTPSAVKLEVISTDAMLVPKGTAAQQPTGVSGYLRFNTDSAQFEGHNGSVWASVGGSAINNDTTTATNIYPLCAAATSGTALNVYTSNAKYLYKPSTGELSSPELIATNGMVLNNSVVSTSYSIPAGYNATATGPITVNGGVVVTVPSGSRWIVL